MITSDNLHSAIARVDSSLLAGRSGHKLRDSLENIALALSVILGECCGGCGADITDGKARVSDGRMLCPACYAKATADCDKAVPPEPFQGSGQRVIRKTGGLS